MPGILCHHQPVPPLHLPFYSPPLLRPCHRLYPPSSPLVLRRPECRRHQGWQRLVRLLFCRAGWHLMHSMHRTLNNLNGSSSKLLPLEISLWHPQSAYELLGPFPSPAFNVLSFISLSLWLPPPHALLSLISLILFSLPVPVSLSLLTLFVTPQLLSPSDCIPFLTSLSTLVTYFLSCCPENTPARSQLIPALLSSLSLSCRRQRGPLIRKSGDMWSRASECDIIWATHWAQLHCCRTK